MPLLESNISEPQVQPQVNKEEVLKRVANQIREKTKESFNQFVRIQKEGIEMLWKQKDVTPQEVIDFLGEDAIKLFQFHGALTEFITQVAGIDGVQVKLATPTKAFEVVDGKITVLNTVYVVD
jgi:alanyl-tRNA synthetase